MTALPSAAIPVDIIAFNCSIPRGACIQLALSESSFSLITLMKHKSQCKPLVQDKNVSVSGLLPLSKIRVEGEENILLSS